MTERRRHIILPPPLLLPSSSDEERRPLLRRPQGDSIDQVGLVYSCRTDSLSQLPVYTNIHRIRRDIVSVVEDYLSLEQLRDVKINLTVIRPLVDKFYDLGDISIIYCLLVNRAQFLEEQSQSSNRQNVDWTRATLCEIIATRILRRFGEDHSDPEGLLVLAHILIAGFEPFQNAPEYIRNQAEKKTWRTAQRTLPSLEVAILTESKHFLSSTACQRVVSAIYEGRIVYTPSTVWDIIPDHYKLKPISIYNPRASPLLDQYRLIVPRTRNILEAIQFVILMTLYVVVMWRQTKFAPLEAPLEAAFAIYGFGWCLDQFATILAHGWDVYTQNLWSFLDVGFIGIFIMYSILRITGIKTDSSELSAQAFDVLALAAPFLVPRLAFNLLSDNLVFLALRSMMADFLLLTALAAWCFFGFLLTLLWLGGGAHPLVGISKWMIYIWFGLDGTGIQRSVEFHWLLGPIVMVTFAFLGNTLFLTILVSMLSNTFSNISSNASAEIQFRKAVVTLEGVKADAIFAYQPPFNLVAVFLLLPLKFVFSPRWFHKIHVATVRLVNLPLLLIIAVAERRLLWPNRDYEGGATKVRQKWFWQKWQLSAFQHLRVVFDVDPPEDVHDDIAVDDDLTHHLIRRQYTRQDTAGSDGRRSPRRRAAEEAVEADEGAHQQGSSQDTDDVLKRSSRRDLMFPGIPVRLRGSFTETGDGFDEMTNRLTSLEATIQRMERMLQNMTPLQPEAVWTDDDDARGARSQSPET